MNGMTDEMEKRYVKAIDPVLTSLDWLEPWMGLIIHRTSDTEIGITAWIDGTLKFFVIDLSAGREASA
ncbi:MAG: hypothetical protein ACI4W2_07660 [Eubacterium sp.]